MSRVFFDELAIPEPAYNLGISGGTHGDMTGRMLAAIEGVILAERPDVVVVHGDTNSTLAGALAAVKLHVPVGHVEAGLRSFNRRMPEEINRVVADHVSDLLFCPTPVAVENLRREGVAGGVHLAGDVMYDSALFYMGLATEKSDVLERLGLKRGEFYLATIHRAENTDDPGRLAAILDALEQAPREVVLPVHPRTRKVLAENAVAVRRVRLIDPVSYLDMLRLEAAARAVLTDSGGVQKEAYFAGVPCITLRDETEWVELVEAGWNRVVGADRAAVAAALEWAESTAARPPRPPLYGDGCAAERIVSILLERAGR
jgi:UDP-N-acetylglucosamine 2-epimerase